MLAPIFAQEQGGTKTGGPSDSGSTPEGKPEQKKKPEKKVDKEKKPQLQLLGSKVTFSAPKRWTKPQVSKSPKLEALQFVIPLPTTGTDTRNTNAIVIAEPNANKLSLADFSNSKIPRKYPAGTIVADQTDGDSWRTVVSYVHEANPPYTVLDRFGVVAGLRVHFRIIFPKEDDAKATWPRTLAQESNEFVRNLRITDKNAVSTELFYNAGKWEMRVAKAAAKTPAKGSTDASAKPKKVEAKKDEAAKASNIPAAKKKEASAPKVIPEGSPQ